MQGLGVEGLGVEGLGVEGLGVEGLGVEGLGVQGLGVEEGEAGVEGGKAKHDRRLTNKEPVVGWE